MDSGTRPVSCAEEHVVLDADFRIVAIGEGCARTAGVRPEDAIGRHVADLLPPPITADAAHELAALRKREAALRDIVDHAPFFAWMKDSEGRLVTANKAFAEYLHLDLDEMTGKTELELFPGDLAEKYRADDLEVMRSAQPRHIEEEGFSGGARHWVETWKFPIVREQGPVAGTVGFAHDITERKLTEEALRLQGAVLGNLSEGVSLVNRDDGRIAFTNPQFDDMFGYAPGELIGRHVSILNAPTDRDPAQVATDILAELTSHGAWSGEIQNLRKDGTIFWCQASVSTFTLPRMGDVWVSVHQDITQRKLGERMLHDAEALFRSSFEAAAIGMALVSVEGRFIDTNPAFSLLTGYSHEELLGKTFRDITHPDDLDRNQHHLERMVACETTSYQTEKRYLHSSGRVVYTQLMVSSVLDAQGRVRCFISHMQDVTERKRSLDALRESEHRFKVALANSPVAVFEQDVDLRYNWIYNPKLGYAASEVIGKTDADIMDRPYASGVEAIKRRVIETGLAERQETAIAAPGSAVEYFDLYVEPLRDASNKIMGVICAATDVTDRRKAEAARALLEAELVDAQKMESLGTLAGGVAHDFNNALVTILGNVSLARGDLAEGHAATMSLEEIGKAARRAKVLVKQILTFGRPHSTDRRATALSPVVIEAARFMRSVLPAMVHLDVTCDADAPYVLADAKQIEQVLINLCTNSLHAVEERAGPGRIEVKLRAHLVGEPRGALARGLHACLSVCDDGSGMDDATKGRVFEPFFTTKPTGKGTGLGLAAVHGILRNHQAFVEVKSALGEGTTFDIYFPALDAPLPRAASDPAETVPVDQLNKRVLYVDDEEAIIFLMKRLLERRGCRVRGVTDGEAALQALRAEPGAFDVVVTDFRMPGMTGLDLAGLVRGEWPDLPVVLASGYVTEELLETARALGVTEVVLKPDTIDELCEAVTRSMTLRGPESVAGA